MRTLLRFFFYLLYHPFAFAYDLVSATVSLGRWKDWVLSVLPFLEGTRILEVGHGPGHLQRALRSRGSLAVGIDESTQMGRLARRSLIHDQLLALPLKSAYAQVNLTRALAQHLPFPADFFDTVVATFPAEYIFAPETLEGAHRVLASHGRLVILPGAAILGHGILDRLMALIFRITGETPPDLAEFLKQRTEKPFGEAGFHVQIHEINIKSSLVFIIVATKS